MSKRYMLFVSENHEGIRMDFPVKMIKDVIKYWQQGKTHNEICNILKMKKIELALIIMDLDYAGKLPAREGGFWGKK